VTGGQQRAIDHAGEWGGKGGKKPYAKRKGENGKSLAQKKRREREGGPCANM